MTGSRRQTKRMTVAKQVLASYKLTKNHSSWQYN